MKKLLLTIALFSSLCAYSQTDSFVFRGPDDGIINALWAQTSTSAYLLPGLCSEENAWIENDLGEKNYMVFSENADEGNVHFIYEGLDFNYGLAFNISNFDLEDGHYTLVLPEGYVKAYYPSDDVSLDSPYCTYGFNIVTTDIDDSLEIEGPVDGLIRFTWGYSPSLNAYGCELGITAYIENDATHETYELKYSTYNESDVKLVSTWSTDSYMEIDINRFNLSPGEYTLVIPEDYIKIFDAGYKPYPNYEMTYPFSIAKEEGEGIISSPKGRETLYTKKCFGTLHLLGTSFDYSEEEFAEVVVWGDNSDVYIWNPLSLSDYGNYIRGRVDGDKITVSVPQPIYFDMNRDCFVNLVVMKAYEYIDDWGRTALAYIYDPSIDSFTYDIAADGTLTLNLPENNAIFDEYLGDYAIGYIYADDNSWTEYADCIQIISPLEGEIVRVPENLDSVTYSLVWSSYGNTCEVAMTGNDIYVKGMNPNLPNGVFKIRREDEKGYIAQNQIMGIFSNYFIYTKYGIPNPDWDIYDPDSPEYIFTDGEYEVQIIDDGRSIESPGNDKALIFNGSPARYYSLCDYYGFRLQYQESFAGDPRLPSNIWWYDEFETGGAGQFFFVISNISEEGNLLDNDSLYYMIYIDGEPMVFSEQENIWTSYPPVVYRGLAEPTTMIPYMFDNGADISVITDDTRRIVDIYNPEFITIGVQAYYIYDNETRWTDIPTYNRRNNRYTTEPGSNAGVSFETVPDGKIRVYNIQGLPVMETDNISDIHNLPKGLYIINGKKVML